MTGFVPPPYPYERLGEVTAVAAGHDGGAVDLSVGTPCDPPPPEVVDALGLGLSARGYPPSIGTAALRAAAARWMQRRLGATVEPDTQLAACVGTKEFVASVPGYLHLRDPSRDTVLYPIVSYPTYEMGATLAGCRAVPYRRLADIDEADAARALALWVNSPGNPTGELVDLADAAAWGRARGVPVLSDECYAEFSWAAGPTTILRAGVAGVLAVHSLSKRDNFAGARIGFYAGDPRPRRTICARYASTPASCRPDRSNRRRSWRSTTMPTSTRQRERYARRLGRLQEILSACGYPAPRPDGAFYLWVPVPGGDAWAAAFDLARQAGIVVSPGEFYGPAGIDHIRVAAVQPDELIDLAARRVGA